MRQALELALEALQMLHDENMDYLTRNKLGGENNQCMVFARDVIKSINRVLAQPEQEPVALQYPQKDIDWQREQQIKAQASTPPQRKPLTDEQIMDITMNKPFDCCIGFARAIEAAHGIKE